jgi:dephospho-CoA kinase
MTQKHSIGDILGMRNTTASKTHDHQPLLIGLTGNIGTGKSTVARMLAKQGVCTIDADKVAHEIMQPGTPVHRRIVEAFGPGILTPDGEIDRKRLGAQVFADAAALAKLETLVHPATLQAIQHRVRATLAAVVVIEAIKLIEVGLADTCDSVWVTTCRPEQQVHRIMGGRGLSRAEAEQRVQAQPPQEDKIARADVVVDTSGTLSQTREQVRTAWERLIKTKSAPRLNLGRSRHQEYNDDAS